MYHICMNTCPICSKLSEIFHIDKKVLSKIDEVFNSSIKDILKDNCEEIKNDIYIFKKHLTSNIQNINNFKEYKDTDNLNEKYQTMRKGDLL
jgi:hypothetical protein